MSHAIPESVTSRTFGSIAEQHGHDSRSVETRKSLEFLPSSYHAGGAMPTSRNPFRSTSVTRPFNDNPFDAAMQAVDETRSRAERQQGKMAAAFGSRRIMSSSQHSSSLSPSSFSLRGSKIMQLLAANQNGSIASPSSISQASQMTTNKHPFSMPERIVLNRNRGGGLQLPSRGMKLPQRRMAPEPESNEFMLNEPSGVDVSSLLYLRRSPNAKNELGAKLERFPSRGMKRFSDESSYSSDSSCGSRKQARRLNMMDIGGGEHSRRLSAHGSMSASEQQSNCGGIERFRNRRYSDEIQASPVLSKPLPRVINTASNRSQLPPTLRFFNNGVEVDINGNPLPPPQPEPEPEPLDFDSLKDHQQSVWDEFTETPEEVEARKKKTRRKAKSNTEAPAEPLNLEVDPTPSVLSSAEKLATADVNDLVQDSLKEREKTLSAASVLMGFLGGGNNNKKQYTTVAASASQSAQV